MQTVIDTMSTGLLPDLTNEIAKLLAAVCNVAVIVIMTWLAARKKR